MTDLDAVPPGYKRTEVGVIPEDWEEKRLGDVSTSESGGTPPTSIGRYYNGGIPWVSIADMTEVGMWIHSTERTLSMDGLAVSAAKVWPKNTVLYAMYASIGECSIAAVDLSSSQAILGIQTKKGLDYHYLYYQLLLRKEKVRKYAQQGTQANLNSEIVRNFLIPFPIFEEQHAIAAALSNADGLIGALDALIAKKRDMKQAAMQQLLTGRTRLPGFEGEWEEKRLGDLAEIDPENLSNSTNLDYCFNYISLEQVDNGRLIGYSEEVFRSSPSRARRKLKKGDVLMSTVRPNLMSHLLYVNQVNNAVCSTGFAVIRARKGLSEPGFLYNHLFSYVVNNQVEKIIAGSNYPAINSRDVKLIEIPCPPTLSEQTAIATVLSDMDAEIAALERRRDKAKAIKQGMMQQLLTGKVRLVSPEGSGIGQNGAEAFP